MPSALQVATTEEPVRQVIGAVSVVRVRGSVVELTTPSNDVRVDGRVLRGHALRH